MIFIASAAQGNTERHKDMHELYSKPKKTFLESVRLLTYDLIHKLGFWGIVFCASVRTHYN